MPRNLAREETGREEAALAFRDQPGQPAVTCPAYVCGFAAIGPSWARRLQLHSHWLSCPGVLTLSFHPDGALASVTFNR